MLFSRGVLRKCVSCFLFSVVDIIIRCRLLCSCVCMFSVSVNLRLLLRWCLWNLLNRIVLIFFSIGLFCSMWVRMFLVMILMCVCVEILFLKWMW